MTQTGFGALLDHHLQHLRLANRRPVTIRERGDALRRYASRLHPVSPVDASREDLDRWQYAIAHLAPTTRITEMAHVTGWHRWLVREQHRADDPTFVLIRPKTPRRVPRPCDEQTLARVMVASPVPLRTFVALAAYAGLRCCEIAPLQRSHVLDHADPPVLFVIGKGGHERMVPLAPVLLDELRRVMPRRGPLFRRDDGSAWSATYLSAWASRRLQVFEPSLSLHRFRHRAATIWYQQSGGDVLLVSRLLGHGDLSTVANYAQVPNGRALEVVTAAGSLP